MNQALFRAKYIRTVQNYCKMENEKIERIKNPKLSAGRIPDLLKASIMESQKKLTLVQKKDVITFPTTTSSTRTIRLIQLTTSIAISFIKTTNLKMSFLSLSLSEILQRLQLQKCSFDHSLQKSRHKFSTALDKTHLFSLNNPYILK